MVVWRYCFRNLLSSTFSYRYCFCSWLFFLLLRTHDLLCPFSVSWCCLIQLCPLLLPFFSCHFTPHCWTLRNISAFNLNHEFPPRCESYVCSVLEFCFALLSIASLLSWLLLYNLSSSCCEFVGMFSITSFLAYGRVLLLFLWIFFFSTFSYVFLLCMVIRFPLFFQIFSFIYFSYT